MGPLPTYQTSHALRSSLAGQVCPGGPEEKDPGGKWIWRRGLLLIFFFKFMCEFTRQRINSLGEQVFEFGQMPGVMDPPSQQILNRIQSPSLLAAAGVALPRAALVESLRSRRDK